MIYRNTAAVSQPAQSSRPPTNAPASAPPASQESANISNDTAPLCLSRRSLAQPARRLREREAALAVQTTAPLRSVAPRNAPPSQQPENVPPPLSTPAHVPSAHDRRSLAQQARRQRERAQRNQPHEPMQTDGEDNRHRLHYNDGVATGNGQ